MRKLKRLRRDWEVLAETIPRSFNNLLEQLQTGNLAVRIKHRPLVRSMSHLVYGLCTSALLLASSMLWVHQVPPTIRGVSIIGVTGYFLAVFLALRVFWVITWDRQKDD